MLRASLATAFGISAGVPALHIASRAPHELTQVALTTLALGSVLMLSQACEDEARQPGIASLPLFASAHLGVVYGTLATGVPAISGASGLPPTAFYVAALIIGSIATVLSLRLLCNGAMRNHRVSDSLSVTPLMASPEEEQTADD